MKKLFAIALAIFVLSAVFCVTAFAAEESASGVVLRVSATMRDGSTKVIKDYTSFEDGWNAAMELASNPKELNKNDYARVIVDIYADWNAVNGEFTSDFFNGKGFNWDAIYFPSNIAVTLNLNNHTINRGLTEYQYNGEVMYIDEKADVIINEGTITGGWSCNGAGGIHINNGANVTLNNVIVVGNVVEDDDGAGIAVYNGATLTMNGGSISQNVVYGTTVAHHALTAFSHDSYGALYVADAEAILDNVTFKDNVAKNISAQGVVAAFIRSTVTMNNCVVEENGYVADDYDYVSPESLIYSVGSLDLTITNTEFKNNGDAYRVWYAHGQSQRASLMTFETSQHSGSAYVNLENCTFTGNKMDYLFDTSGVAFSMTNCTVTDNYAGVAFIRHNIFKHTKYSTFTNCLFNNNKPETSETAYRGVNNPGTFYISDDNANVNFTDCDLGNSTFTNKNYANFTNSSVTGAIFSEGSLTMVISIMALVASIASIGVTIASNKKKKEANQTEEV